MSISPPDGWFTLVTNGWVMTYGQRRLGWPDDGWFFLFIGEDYATGEDSFRIDNPTKDDFLTINDAWERWESQWE